MGTKRTRLARILAALERRHGPPARPKVTDPFEQVLLEHVAYLATDEKRAAAFNELARRVGLSPRAVLDAPDEVLREIARKGGGVAVEKRAERMKVSADLVFDEFGGDASAILSLPPREAERALKRFPSIGEPGAQKILLFAGVHPCLALDSNGLRVLLRLGYGEEGRNYSQSYRSAQAAAETELPADADSLLSAHLLLRRHGRTVCKTSRPNCAECAINESCEDYLGRG